MKTLNLAKGMVMLLAITITVTACQKDIQLPEIDDTPQHFMMVPAGDYFSYSEAEPCHGDEVTVYFNNGYDNNCGHTQIQMWGPDDTDWEQVFGSQDEFEDGVASFTFTPESEGLYAFRGRYTSSGGQCNYANIGWTHATFHLEVVSCQECEWEEETAFGGNSAGEGSAWWYYFDTEGDANQPIYAGQNLTDGSVNWDGTQLVIDLGSWSLRDVPESVKVEGYDVIPSSRPSAGQFGLYKGTDLTINGNGSRYYVIHLDVEICR